MQIFTACQGEMAMTEPFARVYPLGGPVQDRTVDELGRRRVETQVPARSGLADSGVVGDRERTAGHPLPPGSPALPPRSRCASLRPAARSAPAPPADVRVEYPRQVGREELCAELE